MPYTGDLVNLVVVENTDEAGGKGRPGIFRLDVKKGKRTYLRLKRQLQDEVFIAGPKDRAQGKMATWQLRWRKGKTISAQRIVFTDKAVFCATWDAWRKPGSAKLFCIGEEGEKKWEIGLPDFHTRAMILAGSTLYLAGGSGERKTNGEIRAFSAGNGVLKKRWNLGALPVSNGLAAAEGRLFAVTEDGKLHCFGK